MKPIIAYSVARLTMPKKVTDKGEVMSDKIRQEMASLPRWVQPFLTWVTGCPLAYESPLIHWTAGKALVFALLQISVGMVIGYYAFSMDAIIATWLLVLSVCLSAGGMRRLDVIIIHQSLHHRVCKSGLCNRIISELLSTVLLKVPYHRSRAAHLDHHRKPCSAIDEDRSYIYSTGFTPGMKKQALYRYIVFALFSPVHHARALWKRIQANFFATMPNYRRLMSLSYIVILVMIGINGDFTLLFALWLLPLIFVFQSFTYLYTLSEHRWTITVDASKKLSPKTKYKLTFGRLCGDPIPSKSGRNACAKIYAWSKWWLRVFFVHCPYRLCILVGDTVQHDTHHLEPGCDWPNSAYVRNKAIQAGKPGYENVWGSMLAHIREATGV